MGQAAWGEWSGVYAVPQMGLVLSPHLSLHTRGGIDRTFCEAWFERHGAAPLALAVRLS